MTEKPSASEESKEPNVNNESVLKLEIDKPSDFRFHAAYLTYSQAWDKTSSSEVKVKLNEIIEALSKNEIDCECFYERISQYRSDFTQHYGGGRMFIETQRKKDWRRMQEKNARNERHKR